MPTDPTRPTVTAAHRDKRVVDAFAADQPQPRCDLCGRFAARDSYSRRWYLPCVTWDDYAGGYEHE